MTRSDDDLGGALCRLLNGGVALVALGPFGPALLVAGARAAAAADDGEVLRGWPGGGFRAELEGDRLLSLAPCGSDPSSQGPSSGVLDAVYSPARIKYPMVRRAFLDHGAAAERDSRGNGDFVRVSWDRALDLVAREIRRVADSHGPAATFAGGAGVARPGRLHDGPRLLRRLISLTGGVAAASGEADRPFEVDRGTADRIKLAYWAGGTPLVRRRDRSPMRQAWRSLETLIVQDVHWTPAARRADIVLPATTACERNDIERVGGAVLAMKKVIEPVFDSRSDYAIVAALAERLGKGRDFGDGNSELDGIRACYEALLPAAATGGPVPDFDSFWNGAGVIQLGWSGDAGSFAATPDAGVTPRGAG
ncbi:MAG TPA: molybdopterin-dependent oxidoreductase [Rhodopseudomonas sp.]|uniref:molybdopterin-dependent oxidoreductase n=1 Tax=Rhodopseudomonas sp. TaxID=1078 RepID=UPI002ED95622